jgi:ATP-dependent Clp endopeptidase proteolytic subunit ClpP
MADKSPQLIEAEIRKANAEARKAEIEADDAAWNLARRKRIDEEEQAYDHDAHKVFYLNTDVSNSSIEKIRGRLQAWHRQDPTCPIEIVLNSPGGSVFDGLALGDLIESMSDAGHHITTRVAGKAASMAGVILQFGDTRIIGRNSWLHLHEVSTGSIGKASDLEDTAELAKRLTLQACEIYARKSTKSARQIHRMMERHEVWLSPREALELGFCDEID